jgi:hypothetical protein
VVHGRLVLVGALLAAVTCLRAVVARRARTDCPWVDPRQTLDR